MLKCSNAPVLVAMILTKLSLFLDDHAKFSVFMLLNSRLAWK